MHADPTHRKVLAYKVGLCTELPYATNYKQVCDFIYDKTTPIELEAIKNASVSVPGLDANILTEGTEYTHYCVLISNKTYVKVFLASLLIDKGHLALENGVGLMVVA